MDKSVVELLQPALDCYGGTDGGITFVKFKFLIKTLQMKSLNGDKDATKIIDVVKQYNKLIELSKKL